MVYVGTYNAPDVNKKEVLRYAGILQTTPELNSLVDSCLAEVEGKLSYRVCYREFDISFCSDSIDIGFAVTKSADLFKNLCGCEKVLVFAATVGIEIDRLIARYSVTSPSRALIFQAIGTERIEQLCNTFCRDIAEQKRKEGAIFRPRFSVGYGDLPLELQRDIFSALDCPKKIGVTLNESLLMSPSKSVTAIIGIERKR